MIRIPPPEELARRPAPTALALAALDGLWNVAVGAGILIGFAVIAACCAGVVAALVWTIFRFGEWVYRLAPASACCTGAGLPSLAGFLAAVLAGLALAIALTRHTVVLEWLAARAGRGLDGNVVAAVTAAWWAIVCGAVWALT